MNARVQKLDIKNVEEEVINRLNYDMMASLKRINILDYGNFGIDPGKMHTFICRKPQVKL